MLSHQTSFMDPRQRHQQQQQRQHSAPSEIEATHIPQSTAMYHQTGTYQGASLLSQPMNQIRQYIQDEEKVGITNQGHQQQHYLQVAQQHSQARPGQQQPQPLSPLQIAEQEFRIFQHKKLEEQLDCLLHPNSFSPQMSNQHYVKVERSRSNPGQNINHMSQSPRQNVMLFNPDGPIFPLEQTFTQDTTALSTNWSMPIQRPYTPPQQSSHGYFPVTPAETPYGFSNGSEMQSVHLISNTVIKPSVSIVNTPVQRIHEHFEVSTGQNEMSAESTIEAIRRRSSTHDYFQQNEMDFEDQALPSPPQTMPMKSSRHFDVTVMPNTSMKDIPKLSFMEPEQSIILDEPLDSPEGSPPLESNPPSPHSSCGRTSDVVLAIREQESPQRHSPSLETRTSVEYGAWDLAVRTPMSPRPVTMIDLSLDATIEDTGISVEEVQSYMSEQDKSTGKWMCLYPDCARTFGRKENIRSHIQTHLNDRRFKCAHCEKRFVRQHDLKRHAKIHSGVKAFPCRCGNSFARHDALTRHRQRGICDGGFAGVVKKVAKRGRPRKDRPDSDERADKSSRTRKRAAEKSTYASSVSGTSESSFPDSPPMAYGTVDMSTMPSSVMESPIMQGPVMQSPTTHPMSFPPSAFSYTPPVSPYSTGVVPSPNKTYTADTALTPSSLALDDENDHNLGSDTCDMVLVSNLQDHSPFISQPGSPPELSHSSPPSSTTRLHDLDVSGLFSNSELGLSKTDTNADADDADYDMFAAQLNDATPQSLGSSWNANSYFEFDRELKDFSPDFGDEALFPED